MARSNRNFGNDAFLWIYRKTEEPTERRSIISELGENHQQTRPIEYIAESGHICGKRVLSPLSPGNSFLCILHLFINLIPASVPL